MPSQDENPKNLKSAIVDHSNQLPGDVPDSVKVLLETRQSLVSKILSDVPKPTYVIAVDFDGTVVTHEFPEIGNDCPYAVEVLKNMVAHGAGLILFTMRSGEYLDAAVEWFAKREIPLYGIQKNPTQESWTQSNKCYANLYIDDAALGCPLTYNPIFSKRPFVNWAEVNQLLQKHDWFVEPIHPEKTI